MGFFRSSDGYAYINGKILHKCMSLHSNRRGPARLDGYVTPFGCRLKMNMSKFTILMITRATAIDDEDDGQKK